jgi:hypothetical protein
MLTKKLTFAEWYVERERKVHANNPEIKAPFIEALRNHPELVLQGILENAEADVLRAMMDGASNSEWGGTIINDFQAFSEGILEAFKEEFLK